MFLRGLKLRGFKSFPDPVEVRLEPGVAIVVGPNGSGKSNIADAIVWAAGSQSPSELRAEKGEDVLYAGSGERKGIDHCSVELLFDNSAGDGPLPYSELSIARRLRRDGDSEYLINGATVRRTDLVELLADLGLGGEMHSIIGQGRVEQILSSKPEERRAMIEEGAGLGKFKRRRHRAELKLARVANQIERAGDLEAEVRKRLRPLALQASAAARAEKLGHELEGLRAQLGQSELFDLEEALTAIEERRTAATGQKRTHDQKLEGVLTERHSAEEELGKAAARHEEATAALYRFRSVRERLELRRERADEAAATLKSEAEKLQRLASEPVDQAPLVRLAQAEASCEKAAEQARQFSEKRDSLRQRVRLSRERLDALEQGIAEQEGLPPAARALSDAGEHLAFSELEIADGYERAVAAALAGRASAVLARDFNHAFGLLERARSEGLGAVSVLVPRAAADAPSSQPPVPGAEPLHRHVHAHGQRDATGALLADVWLADVQRFSSATHGILVTREGHGYAPERGEIWFAGEAAESVLLGMHARRRSLAEELLQMERELTAAEEQATTAFEAERRERDALRVAQAAVGRMSYVPDPREAAHVATLARAAERASAALRGALEAVSRYEAPLRARVDAGGKRAGDLGEALRRLGAQESELRTAVAAASENLASIGMDAVRLEAERDEILDRLPDGLGPAALETEEVAALETKIERLEKRRESLGNVNPLAAEEHAQEKTRLDELVLQREDLERSLTELESLRAELTETVETRFAETYKAVEAHFEEIAGTLFPGGRGRLTLTDSAEEDEEPGIEIELQPAGKRITRLSLLSGGEKALGAISFLFALFLARPCPFYLLDEVEAALDDNNIGLFVDLLRSFSDRTQFVVITHQKRTMEAADILYGVTMGPDGISQIVSKRLVEAPTQAQSA